MGADGWVEGETPSDVEFFAVVCIKKHLVCVFVSIELPWDTPSYECAEYRQWSQQNYFLSPWTKISNEPLCKGEREREREREMSCVHGCDRVAWEGIHFVP